MVPVEQWPELDRFAYQRLTRLARRLERAYDQFEFHVVYHSVHNFCAVDLSAFYLDVLKDRLYCERPAGPERRAAQSCLYLITRALANFLRAHPPLYGGGELLAPPPRRRPRTRERPSRGVETAAGRRRGGDTRGKRRPGAGPRDANSTKFWKYATSS